MVEPFISSEMYADIHLAAASDLQCKPKKEKTELEQQLPKRPYCQLFIRFALMSFLSRRVVVICFKCAPMMEVVAVVAMREHTWFKELLQWQNTNKNAEINESKARLFCLLRYLRKAFSLRKRLEAVREIFVVDLMRGHVHKQSTTTTFWWLRKRSDLLYVGGKKFRMPLLSQTVVKDAKTMLSWSREWTVMWYQHALEQIQQSRFYQVKDERSRNTALATMFSILELS